MIVVTQEAQEAQRERTNQERRQWNKGFKAERGWGLDISARNGFVSSMAKVL